jgi:hypothetical protein
LIVDVEFLPGRTHTCFNGFGQICLDPLDVLVCLGGFLLQELDGIEEYRRRRCRAQFEYFFRRIGNFVEKFAYFVREQPDPIDVRYDMDVAVVEGLGSHAVGPNNMDLVFPCQNDRVVAAPTHVCRHRLRL